MVACASVGERAGNSAMHHRPRGVIRGPGRALALAVALALALSLTACSGADASQQVTLRFWAFGREGEVVQQLVRDFERENPRIRVVVQQIPWTAAQEKLVTAVVGDATPDVAQLGNTWIPQFAALDAILPLDSQVARSAALDSGRYFPGIWATNQVAGRLYGIPWYVDTRLLFYRTDLFARAGYDSVPLTWAAWREALVAVQRRQGPGRWAIFLPTNEWTQPVIFGLQAGSPLLRDGGRYGAFSAPAFRRAFDFYVGLYRAGLAPIAGSNDLGNVYQEFARGTIAMWITGPWNIGEMKRRLPAELQDRWATAPMPGPTGAASGVSLAGGASLVVFRRSRSAAEAWRLVEFLSRPEQQLRFYRLAGDLPARREAWQMGALDTARYTRAFWTQLQRVVPTPKVPEWELIATRIYETAERVIRGGAPVGPALEQLDRTVNEILEKRRFLLARGVRAGLAEEAARPTGTER